MGTINWIEFANVTLNNPEQYDLDRVNRNITIARDSHNIRPIPLEYWEDKKGRFYIRWDYDGFDSKTVTFVKEIKVFRYWFDDPDDIYSKFHMEEMKPKLTKSELLRGGTNEPVVVITGDTHGQFRRVERFCEQFETTKEDVTIILGDAAINYYGGMKDTFRKKEISRYPITLFCIHGNHEMRPGSIESYKEVQWHGGTVYVEEDYPNILFAKDGEVYDIDGQKVLVLGGAYSVDKFYRLQCGYQWFADEQPNDEMKAAIEKKLDVIDWKVDVVLSHTTPYQYMPRDLFLDSIDQSTVDNSTEFWLEKIEQRLDYKKWYAGHFHCDRKVDDLQIMFKRVDKFCSDVDLQFSME